MPTLVISDFSKTLTAPTSKTTWSLFRESGLFPEAYSAERDRLFEEYRPFELAGDNEKVREWFGKHLDLLGEYDAASKLPDTVLESIETERLLPREGLEEFVEYARGDGVIVRIVSSGISELVQRFLSLHGLKLSVGFKNRSSSGIYANDLLPHDGVRSVLTPTDKLSGIRPLLEGFDRVVVLGDAPEDFAIPGIAYSQHGKFRGFGFSDAEMPYGVVPLGKDASLVEMLDRIRPSE